LRRGKQNVKRNDFRQSAQSTQALFSEKRKDNARGCRDFDTEIYSERLGQVMSNIVAGHAEFVNNDTNVEFKSDAFRLTTIKVPARTYPPRSVNYRMAYGYNAEVVVKMGVN
jgi:hypothetical protein